jgi:hypothetical protein
MLSRIMSTAGMCCSIVPHQRIVRLGRQSAITKLLTRGNLIAPYDMKTTVVASARIVQNRTQPLYIREPLGRFCGLPHTVRSLEPPLDGASETGFEIRLWPPS